MQRHLVDVILQWDATISLQQHDAQKVHAVYADQIEALVFQNTISSGRGGEGIESFIFTHRLFSPTAYFKNVKNRLGNIGSSIAASVTQFPCESSFIGNKTQRQTMESIINGSMSKHRKNGQSGMIYVALSRVTSIKVLFLTALLEQNLVKYKPTYDVLSKRNDWKLWDKYLSLTSNMLLQNSMSGKQRYDDSNTTAQKALITKACHRLMSQPFSSSWLNYNHSHWHKDLRRSFTKNATEY